MSDNSDLQLSVGAIEKLLIGETVDTVILQILGYKKVPECFPDRYRLLINDGIYLFPYAMLSRDLNILIDQRRLEKFTIFKLNRHVCSPISPGKNVIIFLDVEILREGGEVNEKICAFEPEVFTDELNEPQPSTSDQSATTNKQKLVLGEIVTYPFEFDSDYSDDELNEVEIIKHRAWWLEDIDTDHAKVVDVSDDRYWNPTRCTIKNIRPELDFGWYIVARLVSKSGIVNGFDSEKPCKVIKLILIDNTSEIKMIAHNSLARKCHERLQVNRVYKIANATLTVAQYEQEFHGGFRYEIIVDPSTTDIELYTGAESIPTYQFRFVPLDDLLLFPSNSIVDVIGVCFHVSEAQIIKTKYKKQVSKRELQLIDDNKSIMMLTIWDNTIDKIDEMVGNVVAICKAKVVHFGRCSLALTYDSFTSINPDITDTQRLKNWYDIHKDIEEMSSNVPVKSPFAKTTKSFLLINCMDRISDRGCYFTTKATITWINKDRCMYQCCPADDCSRKVVQLKSGHYKCEKCNKQFDSFTWKMLLSITITDNTDSLVATAFGKTAEKLLQIDPEHFNMLKVTDEDKFNQVFSEKNLESYVFHLRSKMESYNNTKQLRTTILDFKPIEPKIFGRKLMADILTMSRSLLGVSHKFYSY